MRFRFSGSHQVTREANRIRLICERLHAKTTITLGVEPIAYRFAALSDRKEISRSSPSRFPSLEAAHAQTVAS